MIRYETGAFLKKVIKINLEGTIFRYKFILQRPIGVQNLFCEGLLECKIYFAKAKIENDPWECARKYVSETHHTEVWLI